jgi:hypothetical protein
MNIPRTPLEVRPGRDGRQQAGEDARLSLGLPGSFVMDVTSPRLIPRILVFPSEGRLSRAVGKDEP